MVMIRFTRSRLPSHKITVLAKEGCHLCEGAIDVLRELGDRKFELEVLDITKDQGLFQRYFLRIPVIRLDGEDIFEVDQIALKEDCRKELKKLVESLT